MRGRALGTRVDDQKWELVPVLITKNRLFESIGGLYKKGSSEVKRGQVGSKFIQAIENNTSLYKKSAKIIQAITTKFIQAKRK